MPIEEKGTTATPTGGIQGGQQPGAISDLGDILLDKSLDTMQKNDFVPVSKSDVANFGTDEEEVDDDPFAKKPETSVESSVVLPVENHATAEDLQTIMLDIPAPSASPFAEEKTEVETPATEAVVEEVAPVEEAPSNNMDIDLGDMSFSTPSAEAVTEPVVTETPTVEAPIVETPVEAPSSNMDIDLGDMSFSTPSAEAVTEPVVAETPTVEAPIVETPVEEVPSSNMDIDLGSLDIPTYAPEVPVNNEVVAEPIVETPVEEQPASSNADIMLDTSSENSPQDISLDNVVAEPVFSETPTEDPIASNADIMLDTSSLEQPVQQISSDTVMTPETTIESVTETPAVEQPVIESVIETAPVIAQEVAVETPVATNDIMTNNVESTTPPSIEAVQTPVPEVVVGGTDAATLEKVAEEISQGIDLDSLMVETPAQTVAAVQQAEQVAPKQSPMDGLKAMMAGGNGSQKKVLIGLGVFAVLGLLYFGYMLMGDSSPTIPTQTPVVIEDSTGDTIDTGESETGAIDPSLSETGTIDDTTQADTGAIAIDTGMTADTGSTTVDTPKTHDEILTGAKDLAGKVRKALIKATIMKNAQMRLSAFTLQQDVDTFIQTLENANDMTTVSDSETKLDSLSQRLDSILQKLNGSSQ